MRIHAMTLGAFLLSGILPLAPSSALAQAAHSVSAQDLASEYQQLRTDLDRVNAEVAALKHAERSVRNDYRLRDKMAQAEALARRVTDAEARLRAARGPSSAENPAGPVEPPVATPQDGVVELEAKADLLSDQARRFQAEADVLVHTAEQIRARQALRRRAGAWDRDPLTGFEASKRNVAIVGQGLRVTASGESSSGATPTNRAAPTQGADGTSKSGGTDGTVAIQTPPIAIDGTGATSTPTTTVNLGGPGVGSTTATATPTPAASGPSVIHPLSAPAALAPTTKAAAQERPLLDPTALASIRSNLSQAGSLSDPEAVEAAAAALRKHAQALEEQARSLRVRAGQQ